MLWNNAPAAMAVTYKVDIVAIGDGFIQQTTSLLVCNEEKQKKRENQSCSDNLDLKMRRPQKGKWRMYARKHAR